MLQERIFTDQRAISLALSEISTAQQQFQKYVDMYNKITELEPLKENDLEGFIRTPKEFLVERLMTGKSLEVGGVTLSKDKLYDIMEKPEGFDDLVSELLKLKTDRYTIQNSFIQLKNLFIKSGTAVEIRSGHINFLEKKHSIYLDSESKERAYELLRNISEGINELKKIKKFSVDYFFEECIILKEGQYAPRPQFIKNI